MKIKVLCINDKDKPHEIPQEKWVVEGNEYHIQHVFNQIQQKAIKGVELSEIDLSPFMPYNCFNLSRFAFRPNDLPKLEVLMKQCTQMNDIDILSIIGDLTMIEQVITPGTLIADCKISIRAKNILENARILTIAELIKMPKSHLMKFRRFGTLSFKEVVKFVKDNGFEFKEE